jgi:NADH-quinone oxidoreductase subunit A
MPYESGMDPIHDTRRRFDVRFHLVAIAFLVFDVELLFLYPWAVAVRNPAGIQSVVPGDGVAAPLVAGRELIFAEALIFIVLLAAGFVYAWRKGVFQWR